LHALGYRDKRGGNVCFFSFESKAKESQRKKVDQGLKFLAVKNALWGCRALSPEPHCFKL